MGMGFCGVLTIVFIVLKLCGVIAWAWTWVISPLWICLSLVLILTTITTIIKIKKGGK